MGTVLELRHELRELVEQSRAILDRAEREQRERTPAEEQELRRLDAKMDQIEADVGRAEREERLAQPVGRPGIRPEVPPLDEPGRRAPATGARFRDTRTGQEIRA